MNRRMIAFVLGRVLLCEAALMLPSVLVGFIYNENSIALFLPAIIFLVLSGTLLGFKKPENTEIFAKDGLFVVAAAWVLMSLAGAIPFYLCGKFESVWDCIFEIVSGFTTTGASVLSSVEELPKCILFWRSFSHWIGGMGVLVFVLAIMPLSDNRSLHLMRAEVPGPVVGKLVPRMRDTAKILYGVYTAMTIILAVLLVAGGMPPFDSICHAFGAAGTGGFSVKNAGIMYYQGSYMQSSYFEIVLSVFMLLFGANFNLYYLILIKHGKEALKSEELRWYMIIVAFAVITIAASVFSLYKNVGESLRLAFFQVSSIITTTGYATADFANQWPQYSQHLLVLLMIIGASAGSTGGGLKVSRVILLIKSAFQKSRQLLHPRAVSVIRLENKTVDADTLQNTSVYFMIYILIICVSTLLLSLDGFDFTTNLSAELACFNNIGPGLSLVGPVGNYGFYSPLCKMLLSVNMLFGRLEIFPMLVLFSPQVWRQSTD